MAYSPQEIKASGYLTTTATALTTAKANKMKITHFSCTEQANNGVNVTFWIVPSGGSRGNDNRFVNNFNLLAGELYSFDQLLGKIIPINATIHGQASTGTTNVTVAIDATVFTDPA